MDQRLIALAIPVFLLAMVVEWLLNSRYLARGGPQPPTGGVGGYRMADTLSDLGCGVGQQALDPVLRGIGVAIYAAVQQNTALFTWDATSPAAWFLAMFLVDFCYYWFHRACHRSHLFWAVHHVHHSSEEYNLAVALRQPWFEKLVDIPFYLPLAVLGMPVELYLGAFTIDLLYQFFIHARFVPRLGPLEWLLNTPSHHRVHHGVNPAYIDRNYGGILILFDRLFGTFEPEGEPVVYGTVTPLQSWNPAWANVAVWVELARKTATMQGFAEKLWLWLGPPEWRPAAAGGPLAIGPPDLSTRGWQGPNRPAARVFGAGVLVALVALLGAVLWTEASLSQQAVGTFTAATLLLLAGTGAALDGRNWAPWLAWPGLAALGLGLPLLADWPVPVVAGCAAVAAGLAGLAGRKTETA
ncbi:MAG: sterol desaturase family protein [Deltaproteobacteria bacterium]|nr:sterol desaturase family protein [Deltaproteobacteria bacterium]